jgi:hypothetical protein
MSQFWQMICKLLIAIIEELIATPADRDHIPTATTGLSIAKRLIKGEDPKWQK